MQALHDQACTKPLTNYELNHIPPSIWALRSGDKQKFFAQVMAFLLKSPRHESSKVVTVSDDKKKDQNTTTGPTSSERNNKNNNVSSQKGWWCGYPTLMTCLLPVIAIQYTSVENKEDAVASVQKLADKQLAKCTECAIAYNEAKVFYAKCACGGDKNNDNTATAAAASKVILDALLHMDIHRVTWMLKEAIVWCKKSQNTSSASAHAHGVIVQGLVRDMSEAARDSHDSYKLSTRITNRNHKQILPLLLQIAPDKNVIKNDLVLSCLGNLIKIDPTHLALNKAHFYYLFKGLLRLTFADNRHIRDWSRRIIKENLMLLDSNVTDKAIDSVLQKQRHLLTASTTKQLGSIEGFLYLLTLINSTDLFIRIFEDQQLKVSVLLIHVLTTRKNYKAAQTANLTILTVNVLQKWIDTSPDQFWTLHSKLGIDQSVYVSDLFQTFYDEDLQNTKNCRLQLHLFETLLRSSQGTFHSQHLVATEIMKIVMNWDEKYNVNSVQASYGGSKDMFDIILQMRLLFLNVARQQLIDRFPVSCILDLGPNSNRLVNWLNAREEPLALLTIQIIELIVFVDYFNYLRTVPGLNLKMLKKFAEFSKCPATLKQSLENFLEEEESCLKSIKDLKISSVPATLEQVQIRDLTRAVKIADVLINALTMIAFCQIDDKPFTIANPCTLFAHFSPQHISEKDNIQINLMMAKSAGHLAVSSHVDFKPLGSLWNISSQNKSHLCIDFFMHLIQFDDVTTLQSVNKACNQLAMMDVSLYQACVSDWLLVMSTLGGGQVKSFSKYVKEDYVYTILFSIMKKVYNEKNDETFVNLSFLISSFLKLWKSYSGFTNQRGFFKLHSETSNSGDSRKMLIRFYVGIWEAVKDLDRILWARVLIDLMRISPYDKAETTKLIHTLFKNKGQELPASVRQLFIETFFARSGSGSTGNLIEPEPESGPGLGPGSGSGSGAEVSSAPKLTKMERIRMEYQLEKKNKRMEEDGHENAGGQSKKMKILDDDWQAKRSKATSSDFSNMVPSSSNLTAKFTPKKFEDRLNEILALDVWKIDSKLPQEMNRNKLSGMYQDMQAYCEIWDAALFTEFKADLARCIEEIKKESSPLLFGNCKVSTSPEHLGSASMFSMEFDKENENLETGEISECESEYSHKNISSQELILLNFASEADGKSNNKPSEHAFGYVQVEKKPNAKNSFVLIVRAVLPRHAFIGPGKKLSVCRVTSLASYNRQFEALWKLWKASFPIKEFLLDTKRAGRKYEYPGNDVVSEKIPKDHPSRTVYERLAKESILNPSQLFSIKKFVFSKRQDGFHLVQGPPGTGKTATIIGLLSCLLAESLQGPKKCRVLVCAPSNAAVDEIAVRLMDRGVTTENGNACPIMLRIGSGSKNERIDSLMLSKMLRARVTSSYSEKRKKLSEELVLKKREISSLNQEIGKHDLKRKELIDTLKSNELSATELQNVRTLEEMEGVNLRTCIEKKSQLIKSIQKLESLLDDNRLVEEANNRKLIDNIIQSTSIVLCTLNSAGHEHLTNFTSYFKYVIIDEAAQTIEPDVVIPLISAGTRPCSKCIMIGDARQLPATVLTQCPRATELLSISLFERLEKAIPDLSTMLRTQYRMDPSISCFPSKAFYEGKLEDAPIVFSDSYHKVYHKDKESRFGPVTFIDTCDEPFTEVKGGGGSLCNLGEARLVVNCLYKLYQLYGSDLEEGCVSILTPYRSQVREIKRLLAARRELWNKGIDVSTVDGIQGQEKDIILFSSVRKGTNSEKASIGFLKDVRRMNVALTRAKHSIIFFGDSKVLEAGSPTWGSYVQHSRDNGYIRKATDENGRSVYT